MAEIADDVLHHYDRSIDDHPEVQRSQRQQVSRDMTKVQTDGGKQQRKRDCERDDERTANIPQEHKEDDHDEDDALAQVMQHRVRGVVKKIAAVEKGYDLYAWRKNAVVELVDLLVDAFKCELRVVAFLQKDDTFDDI